MHAQTVEAGNWWARPRGATSANWIANYQRSLRSRQREVLVEILRELQPETVVEIGAHCGPNLVRFAQEFPRLRMIGLDVNPEAVAAGRTWVAASGFASRIQLNVGRFPAQTEAVPAGAFDVALSCYTLAYVAPPDLDAALYELGRLATRAVVVAEPMHDPPQWHGTPNGYQEWAHHYLGRVRWLNSWHGMTTRVVPIDPPVDKLAAVLVAVRDTTPMSSTP